MRNAYVLVSLLLLSGSSRADRPLGQDSLSEMSTGKPRRLGRLLWNQFQIRKTVPVYGAGLGKPIGAPLSVAVDRVGSVYFSSRELNCVFKLERNGIPTPIAGDGGLATSALLWQPIGVAVDAVGNLFIADFGNRRIRKVSPSGIITTVAGNGL